VQTRRDQLHAYRFQNRRALAALVTGEPNVLEPPMRRLTVITVSGIMIAILVACGFGLVGIFKPATGDKWREAGAIIVERETGARYVLIDDTLHPVLNYASAVLAVGPDQHPHVVLVDRGDLKSARRGATIGIDGIPDSLPSAGNLITHPWTVCSRQQAGGNQQLSAQVSVLVGSDAGARPVPTGSGVLVRAVDGGTTYLLLNGRRLEVASTAVATSLGLPVSASVQVGTAFLNGVPAGPTLRAPKVPRVGSTSAVSIDGAPVTVGRLLFTRDNQRYFLVLADGVAPLDEVQAQLLLTLPVGPGGQLLPRIETTESAVLNQPASREWSAVAEQLRGLPSRIPQIAGGAAQNGGVCVVYRDAAAQPVVAVPPSRLPAFASDQVVESDRSRTGQADDVVLQPGRAAVARAAGGAPTVFVVADPGRKYATASSDVLGGFGYGGAKPAVVPAEVLLLVPTGPALDPAAARRPTGS
jgi:type VII secretion protein EccB